METWRLGCFQAVQPRQGRLTAFGFRPFPLLVSRVLGSRATGAVEPCTTDMMTDGRKLRQRGHGYGSRKKQR